MSWGISPDAYNALRQSSAVRTRITAITAAQGELQVPCTGGSVTYDASSTVRRQGSVSFPNDPAYWPVDPYSVLSPWGTKLKAEFGIVLPGGMVEYVPLMTGVITETPYVQGSTDEIQVKISDSCSLLTEDRLDPNTSTKPGFTVVQVIRDLIAQVIPDAWMSTIGLSNDKPCPVTDLDQDRMVAITKLAASIGYVVFCDRLDNFIIKPQATENDVFTFDLSGRDLITQAKHSDNRDVTYNRVLVSGESNATTPGQDQTPPVHAVATDDDPASPTRYGGPFGKKTRFYSSSFIKTQDQANTAAPALLQKVKGLARKVDYTAITDPTLSEDDVGYMRVGGRLQKHIISSVTHPFKVSDTQDITTRKPTLPDEQDQDKNGSPPIPATDDEDPRFRAVTVRDCSQTTWNALWSMGYRGRPQDTEPTMYVPTQIFVGFGRA